MPQYIAQYFITYFFLLAIAFLMTIVCIQKIREHRRISICVFIIMGLAFTLSIVDSVKEYAQVEFKNVFWTTALASLAYVLRPSCVLAFIILSGEKVKGIRFYILLGLMAVCTIIYILPLFPIETNLVFRFVVNDQGILSFQGANNPLRFTSHIIAGLYLLYLVYNSIAWMQAKHLSRSFTILFCGLVVIGAVVIETFFNANGNIHLLTTSIGISTVFYYLHLYAAQTKYDALTGLFNRAAYYDDLARFGKEVNGVIQVDMNGLKYLNDTFGHLEGDAALTVVAETLNKHSTRKQCAYRLGGDEFTILSFKEDEGKIVECVRAMKEDLAKTKYRCSFGYAVRKDGSTPLDDIVKLAEARMYEDKAEFYKSAPFERRKIHNPTEE